MSGPGGLPRPLDEPRLAPSTDRHSSADKSSHEAHLRELAYGCVDWFEYSDANVTLPPLEIRRFDAQRVEKERDEQPLAAAKNAKI